MELEKIIKQAKQPGGVNCPICGEELFSPMDKLSIYLYEKCPIHLEDNSAQEENLLTISEVLY